MYFSRLLDHLGYPWSVVQNIHMFSVVLHYGPKLLYYAAQTTDHYSLKESVGLNAGLQNTKEH